MIREILPGEMRRFDTGDGWVFHIARCGVCRDNFAETPHTNFADHFAASLHLASRGWRNEPPYAWCCPGCAVFVQSVQGVANGD